MKFDVSLHFLSQVFWSAVPQPSLSFDKEARSVTHQNASYLMGLCMKLGPETVIELGTGKSTEVMAEVDAVRRIYTGDRERPELNPHQVGRSKVETFTGESTEFFKSLSEKADLFFIDGRLRKDDVAEIKRLSKPHAVYVLDDFEGIEKGVTNALLLVADGLMLMQPVDGKYGRSTIAALIPKDLIRLVNQ